MTTVFQRAATRERFCARGCGAAREGASAVLRLRRTRDLERECFAGTEISRVRGRRGG
jgi:hypothetical protein